MSALETFPDGIGDGVTFGPKLLTDVVELESGWESRNVRWAQARREGEIRVPANETAHSQTLLAFFVAVGAGRANKFRFKDWSDFRATAAQGVFAMIDATHFQAYKRYSFGSDSHERKITRLRGTPTITGTATSPSWDLDTGILTVASGTPSSWAGMFDVPCRFDTDHMQWQIVAHNPAGPIIEWSSVPIVEVRE
jgi:uncharacterized protein (TIGR02217 family)